MTTAIVTFRDSSGDESLQKMWELALVNREEYCERHGYKHWTYHGEYQAGFYYAIQRLMYLEDRFLVDFNVNAVWILNLSSVITDLRRPLTEWSSRPGAVHICRDRNGLNAGSFLLTRCQYPVSRDWLRYVILRAMVVNHPWHEQRAIQEAEEHPMFRELYDVVDAPAFNQYRHELIGWPRGEAQDWKPGDFAVSFPGTPLFQRPGLMREVLTQVVR